MEIVLYMDADGVDLEVVAANVLVSILANTPLEMNDILRVVARAGSIIIEVILKDANAAAASVEGFGGISSFGSRYDGGAARALLWQLRLHLHDTSHVRCQAHSVANIHPSLRTTYHSSTHRRSALSSNKVALKLKLKLMV
jgi:hypothetical protein